MPLDLHPEARLALATALSQELRKIEVEHNSFLRHASTAGLVRLDLVLPNTRSKVGLRIAHILGDEPFSDFVYDQLSILLNRRTFSSEASIVPLQAVQEFQNLDQVAENLVVQFNSLPWSYSIFARIPYEIGRRLSSGIQGNVFVIDERYRLIRFEEGSTEYPPWPNKRPSLLTIPTEHRFEPNVLYLNAQLSGYVGKYLGLRPLEEFTLALRAFVGIGVAERVFRPRHFHFLGDRQASVIAFRGDGDAWEALEPQDLDPRIANLLHSVGPDSLIAKEGDPKTKYVASDFLMRAKAAFDENVVGERLLGSAQWLCDSYADTNSLLAFVQAMVALEILYGDKATSDVVGVGELLANRCAYSIARTRAQREEVLADFKRIYETRSKIVHRGHSRLSRREERDLDLLRWMVARALQEEIELSMAK
jgi:hypothetical protein